MATVEQVLSYRKFMLGVALTRVPTREAAEDVVQESLIRALRSLPDFRGDCGVKTWLRKIVQNQAINYNRSASRRELVSIDEIEELESPALPEVFKEEEIPKLRRAIQLLPERQRETVMLRVYEGLDFEEVADRMGCAYYTAKANYRHAIVSLIGRLRR